MHAEQLDVALQLVETLLQSVLAQPQVRWLHAHVQTCLQDKAVLLVYCQPLVKMAMWA